MKIYILVTLFFFGGVWANNLPIEEFSNSTLNAEEILSRQERGDTNNKVYQWGMLGAACRLASFYCKFYCKLQILKTKYFCESNYA
jgi:hypothetical protein